MRSKFWGCRLAKAFFRNFLIIAWILSFKCLTNSKIGRMDCCTTITGFFWSPYTTKSTRCACTRCGWKTVKLLVISRLQRKSRHWALKFSAMFGLPAKEAQTEIEKELKWCKDTSMEYWKAIKTKRCQQPGSTVDILDLMNTAKVKSSMRNQYHLWTRKTKIATLPTYIL